MAWGRQSARKGANLAAVVTARPISRARRSWFASAMGTSAAAPRLRPIKGASRRNGTTISRPEATPIKAHATGVRSLSPRGHRQKCCNLPRRLPPMPVGPIRVSPDRTDDLRQGQGEAECRDVTGQGQIASVQPSDLGWRRGQRQVREGAVPAIQQMKDTRLAGGAVIPTGPTVAVLSVQRQLVSTRRR